MKKCSHFLLCTVDTVFLVYSPMNLFPVSEPLVVNPID